MNFKNSGLYRLSFSGWLFPLVLAVVLLNSPSISGQQEANQYGRMKEKPKLLFNKWAEAQNTAENKSLPPAERLANLPISRRSVFAAITNALLNSRLTDPASGKLIGFAIDLIEEIEMIAGQEAGKRSDEQFRLYVKLKDSALTKLDVSPEFIRDKDNTIFHKGYPTNYRQSGNAPTLQFSITPDGTRADIDIDYHSSGFPAALFNGHLTAANSDVRASGNYLTHLKRWSGLVNWWDDDFPDLAAELAKIKDKNPTANISAAAEATLEAEADAAINAFFKAWLIERDIDQAMSYLQSDLTFCSDLEESPDKKLLASRYKALFLNMLKAANKQLKNPKTLDQAINPVAAIDPLIPAVEHPMKDLFTLAIITDGDYDHFVCASPKTGQKTNSHTENFGRHYVVKFRFALANGNGGILRLMWTKESGNWKIESFDAVTA